MQQQNWLLSWQSRKRPAIVEGKKEEEVSWDPVARLHSVLTMTWNTTAKNTIFNLVCVKKNLEMSASKEARESNLEENATALKHYASSSSAHL